MKTAICTIIKDEQEYLKEWLEWHLGLGIDEIYLYEDYNSVSHLSITSEYGDKVKLFSINEIFTNGVIDKTHKRQHKLFNWFPIKYKDDLDWVLFIDIDEFLILKYDLHKLLEEYSNESGILLHWKWYGASGHINKPEGGVIENYTIESPNPFDYWWNHKSFMNLKKYNGWQRNIHEVSNAAYPITDYGMHKAWINHYFTKSWEEWKTKLLSRGDVFPGNRKIEQFFNFNPDMLDIKDELIKTITEHINN